MHLVFPTRSEPFRAQKSYSDFFQKPHSDFFVTPSAHCRLLKSILEVIDLSEVKCHTHSWNYDPCVPISPALALSSLGPGGLP